MDLTKKYNSAYRYAHAVNPSNDRDLLHDAYLTWYNKTGKNLFEEHDGTIRKVIKHEYYNGMRRNSYMVKGQRIKKYCGEYNEEYMSSYVPTPEDTIIAKELDSHFTDSFTSEIQLEIYLYAVQGYRPVEIAEILGMHKETIRRYFKKMAYTASLFN